MRIFEYENINEMSFNAAKTIVNFYDYYIKKQGYFTLVLAGGNTPKLLYEMLSVQSNINWKKVYLFLGDERYVPLDNEFSNYKMIKNNLISKIDIPKENVFYINTDISDIENCSKEYEERIKTFFDKKEVAFDLILLGMGEDGHTASIFPDTEVSNEKYVDFIYPENANPKLPRITLTYKAINNSKNVVFLISGEKKINILKEVLKGEKKYPVSKISPKENLLFFVSKN
ncbi:6-phosphogluconolactonase [Marinitoga litoralis]|uniref:6-phosphogluconolactonase n=1 Tax=Marinitoga litoralis TaxID=570855 RepID=UPI00195FC55B|nr:6-phosphogluconolactonase [Marinitoga litoralis]MBM7558471.1 6-phosphogluconolactonase [Marinitoga litoralis]